MSNIRYGRMSSRSWKKPFGPTWERHSLVEAGTGRYTGMTQWTRASRKEQSYGRILAYIQWAGTI